MSVSMALPSSSPVVIGLTGGIGCGKSTVADLFAQKGVAIVDADMIARQLTSHNGMAIAPIRAAFGDAAIAQDGSLNRQQMRERVFQDAAAKLRLEAILHPAIHHEVNRQIILYALQNSASASKSKWPDTKVNTEGNTKENTEENTKTDANIDATPLLTPAPYILLVVPLLFESLSYRKVVARMVAIDCPQSLQIARVMQRSNMSADEVQRIMATQIPRAVRLQLADDVIFNHKAASDLQVPVNLLHQRFVSLAERHAARDGSANVSSTVCGTKNIAR